MPPSGYFVDANLLVLLVAGSVDRRIIARHRRLREFTEEDYEALMEFVGQANAVFVTPNTLTEASNLLAQHENPERMRLLAGLRVLIEESEEVVVRSARASASEDYLRLGLTDAALLDAVTTDTPVVTADIELYRAAARKNPEAGVSFRHLRA